ncbi:MAG: M20/M25/M40 family metallo-hydrolase [Fidelibacterota bacterium]
MVIRESLTGQFIELLKIGAPSLAEAPVVDYIREQLKELNIKHYEDNTGKKVGGNAGNIICSIKGQTDRAVPILFVSHLDTVEPCHNVSPRIENGIITADGRTILGADDRAGVAAILETLRLIRQHNIQHGDLKVVFTVAEEIGLLGSKNLDISSLQSKFAFVLDCANADPGKIVTQAPASVSFKAKCTGRTAHAATAPEKGINAIHFACKSIAALTLGKIDEDTVANIGVISGGRAINIVPDDVGVEGEVRSFDRNKLTEQLKEIRNSFKRESEKVGGNVEFIKSKKYDAFHLKESDEVVRIAVQAIKNVSLKPELIRYIGGSDANVLNAKGIPAVNLGLGISNAHSTEESIRVENMVKITEALIEIIKICSNIT